MQDHLPPAAQEKYQEMRALQAEAESVVTRTDRIEERRADARAAREALDDAEGSDTVYRRVGDLRVETDAASARAALDERIAELDDRIAALDERKGELEERFEASKDAIRHLIGGPGGGPGTTPTSGTEDGSPRDTDDSEQEL
ncbi:prefoldin subunit [Halorubrum tibetense]|uniref:Prefoldin subunit n=1 Tax=Halorubrum tibetense TaxID=175631 RepID=A0ABD5SC66_9EURY